MKTVLFVLALSVAAPSGEAAEARAQQPLQLKPKAAMAAVAVSPRISSYAPFLSPAQGPELDLIPRAEVEESPRSRCSDDRTLCYDASSGRIVYRPARALMPDIPGLRPENISVKRNKIVFRYSF